MNNMSRLYINDGGSIDNPKLVTIKLDNNYNEIHDRVLGFVIDKSGSMAGNNMKTLKKLLSNLVEQFYITHKFFLIAYSGYTITMEYDSNGTCTFEKGDSADCELYNGLEVNTNKQNIIDNINKITANGRTSFQLAFELVTSIVDKIGNKPLTDIIFIT